MTSHVSKNFEQAWEIYLSLANEKEPMEKLLKDKTIQEACLKIFFEYADEARKLTVSYPSTYDYIAKFAKNYIENSKSKGLALKTFNLSPDWTSPEALIKAVQRQDVKAIEILLAIGKHDVNAQDSNSKRPLVYALESDNFEIVQLLCNSGADFSLDLDETGIDGVRWIAEHVGSVKHEKCRNYFWIWLWRRDLSDKIDENYRFSIDLMRGILYHQKDSELLSNLQKHCSIYDNSSEFKNLFSIWKNPNLLTHHLSSTIFNSPKKIEETLEYLLKSPGENFVINYPNLSSRFFSLTMKSSEFSFDLRKRWIDKYPHLIQGPQGKQLLYQAIKSSNYQAAKDLIKAGVKINESYNSPLVVRLNYGKLSTAEHPSLMPPLTHALLKKNYEIAEFMLHEGVLVDVLNKKNETPLQTIFNKKGKEHRYLDVMEWLIKRGANPNIKNADDLTLFEWTVETITETGGWELVSLLLDKNAMLSPEYSKKLLLKAIETTDKKNIAKILEKHKDPSAFIKIPLTYNEIEEILHLPKVIEKKDYEKDLRQKINGSTLGHLLGDEFLTQSPYAGEARSVSLDFMESLVCHIGSKYGSRFKKKTRSIFQDMESKLREAKKISVLLERQQHDIAEKEVGRLKKLSLRLRAAFTNLPEGESLLLPWGWRDTTGGHAMLIDCVKKSDHMIFYVYNTGSGIDFHESETDAFERHVNTVRTYKVPLEEIADLELLQALYEPIVLGHFFGKDFLVYKAINLYEILSQYQIFYQDMQKSGEEGFLGLWMRPQLSGTCSMRCILAYIAHKIGRQEYDKFKLYFGSEVIQFALEENREKFKEDYRFAILLKNIEPNFVRKASKKMRKDLKNLGFTASQEFLRENEELLINFKAIQKALDEIFPAKPTTSNQSVEHETCISLTDEMLKNFVKISVIESASGINESQSEENEEAPILLSMPIIEWEDIREACDLVQTFKSFEYYLAFYEKNYQDESCLFYRNFYHRVRRSCFKFTTKSFLHSTFKQFRKGSAKL